MVSKEERQTVFDMYGGRCAYCGKELGKRWHADHVVPIYRGHTDAQFERMATFKGVRTDLKRGVDSVENMMPACARCNGWKSTMDIETFRNEIMLQVDRARAYSCNFRMAEDFGLIQKSRNEVIFYFEKHKPKEK